MACGHVLTDAGDEISMFIRENPSHIFIYIYTLWLFNVAAIGNGPFIDGLPIKKCDFPWLCCITRGYTYIYIYMCIL